VRTAVKAAVSPAVLEAARINLSTPAVRSHFHAGPVQQLKIRNAREPAAAAIAATSAAESAARRRSTPTKAAIPRPSMVTSPSSLNSPIARAAAAAWPARHLPVSSGVPGASVVDLSPTIAADALFFVCGCRRPVGDVSLCPHAGLHMRLRRWASTLQRLVEEEARTWLALSVAARNAAVARATAEAERRAAFAPPPPVMYVASASFTNPVALMRSDGRRRSSVTNGSLAAVLSESFAADDELPPNTPGSRAAHRRTASSLSHRTTPSQRAKDSPAVAGLTGSASGPQHPTASPRHPHADVLFDPSVDSFLVSPTHSSTTPSRQNAARPTWSVV
jgi:hypothetical protein